MARLRSHGCNIDSILATSDEKLGELLTPVGFWRVSGPLRRCSMIAENLSHSLTEQIFLAEKSAIHQEGI